MSQRAHVKEQTPTRASIGGVLVAALPLALAIGIFGTVYGATARLLMGPFLTVASSMLIWSGAVQFAVLGLLLSGTPTLTALLAAAVLNLRNLLLGATLRARIGGPAWQRSLLAWFLIDETVGLTLASREQPARTLVVAGTLCYVTWFAGTLLGVAGATLASLRPVAEAVFPVLFIALAAISATSPDRAARAAGAVVFTAVMATLWPAARGIIPIVAALGAALPGDRRP